MRINLKTCLKLPKLKSTVSVLTLVFLVLTSNKAIAAKQYIFSRSNHESNSNYLGLRAVPAYVSTPQGNLRGIYITSAQNQGGLWNSMGLTPGTVLLNLDGRIIESPSQADNYLGQKSSGQVAYSYVRMKQGKPQVINSRFNYYGASASAAGVASPSVNTAKQEDKTPISELESHAYQLINKDRSQNGQSTVSQNSSLSNFARSYAEYLIQTSTFSHTDKEGRDPQARAKLAGIIYGVSENLSTQTRGYASDKELLARSQAQMMAEPPGQANHRGNILSPKHSSVGVGVARNSGRIVMVQEFADN